MCSSKVKSTWGCHVCRIPAKELRDLQATGGYFMGTPGYGGSKLCHSGQGERKREREEGVKRGEGD